MSLKIKHLNLSESYKFYNGTIELRYDPAAHVYFRVIGDDLSPLDGVTTVCKIIDKSNVLINWAVKLTAERILSSVQFPISEEELKAVVLKAKSAHRERLEDAGTVGKQAHNLIEEYIKRELRQGDDPPSKIEDERVQNCYEAALSWMRSHNVRWVCTERKVFSRKYDYAGTLDGIALVDSCDNPLCCPHPFKDRRSLIDWKSSNYLYQEYLYQTAAYQYAYQEETKETVEERWVIRLGKDDGVFEGWHLGPETSDEDFLAFLGCLDLTRRVQNVTNRVSSQKKEKKLKLKEKSLKVKKGE
jgi:hypothetical protein